MRVRLILGWIVLFSLVAAIGYAQTPSPTLSLQEALAIARRSNPTYLSTLNNRAPASRGLLSSNLSLFTPQVSVFGTYQRTGSGAVDYQLPNGQFIQFNGPVTSRKYGQLQFRYDFSGASIANRGLASADLRAADEDIRSAGTMLESTVRKAYLDVAEAQARQAVASRAVERATEQLNLSRARFNVGQGTLLDVRTSEVAKARADVALLQATQTTENTTLALYRTLGVPAPTVPEITLTDSFAVTTPPWQLDSLLAMAMAQNPAVRSLHAQENSARWASRSVRSEYLPTLSFSMTKSRQNQYQAAYTDPANTPVPEQSNWSTSPWSFSASVSLPIYDAFRRNARIASAEARQDDLRQLLRDRELQVRTDVVSAFNGLQAAYLTVGLQQTNKVAATEALDLANQRYRVGSGSYLELLNARVDADQADADYTAAVYSYHRAIATLENAVGRPLR